MEWKYHGVCLCYVMCVYLFNMSEFVTVLGKWFRIKLGFDLLGKYRPEPVNYTS